MLDKAFNVLGAVVTLALVATIFGSKQTRGIIHEFAGGFAGLVRSAQGRR